MAKLVCATCRGSFEGRIGTLRCSAKCRKQASRSARVELSMTATEAATVLEALRARPDGLHGVIDRLASVLPRPSTEVAALALLGALVIAYDNEIAARGERGGATLLVRDLAGRFGVPPLIDLAASLYTLDAAGITRTRDGRTLLLRASALTRRARNVVRATTAQGQEVVYAGIAFA